MLPKLLKARLTDGSSVRFDPEPIGAGVEKLCFASEDRQQVVLLFLETAAGERQARIERLRKLMSEWNVVERSAHPAYWRDYFCWPTGLIDEDSSLAASFLERHQLASPPLGIVAPRYRAPFFFKDRTGHVREGNARWFTAAKARRLVPPEEMGNFLTRLQICLRVARAVGKLHAAGLAHSDLSNKNVLISPRTGEACITDVDALVVPGLAPPAVLGTPGYIAPEVLTGHGAPGIEADRFAMGVLFYELLLGRHPLARERPLDAALSPEEDEFLAFGERALFVEHPSDGGNWPRAPFAVAIQELGSALAGLFVRLFVEGLHAPKRRPAAAEWETALYHTFNVLHPSPGGSEWFVVEPPSPALLCPWTKQTLPGPVPFARFAVPRMSGGPGDYVYDGHSLTIWNGLRLMIWHLDGSLPGPASDRTPRGYFSQHGGRWSFVNGSGAPMRLGDGRELAAEEAVEIAQGLQVFLSDTAGARMMEFGLIAGEGEVARAAHAPPSGHTPSA